MAQQICSQASADEAAARRAELYEQYIPQYYGLIRKICREYTKNSSDVDDNYNEVLLNFYKRIDTYNPKMTLFKWVWVVARRYVNYLERRRHRYASLFDWEYKGWEDSNSEGGRGFSPRFENCGDLYDDEVKAALEAIGEDAARLILLREEGYTIKEIAKIEYDRGALESGNTETVKSRLFAARAKLKNKLKDYSYE